MGVVWESGVSVLPLRSFMGLSCIIIQTEPLLRMKVGVTNNYKASAGQQRGDTECVPGRPGYGLAETARAVSWWRPPLLGRVVGQHVFPEPSRSDALSWPEVYRHVTML